MKRRNLLLGLGTAASVGTGVIGTGAVSQITADREFNLSIVQDKDAYLGIQSSTPTDLVGENSPPTGSGIIQIDLTEFNDLAVGSGFNKRATTELTDPADRSGPALFTVQNQSDRDIQFAAATVGDTDDLQDIRPIGPDEKIPKPADDQIQIELFDVTDNQRKAINQNTPRTLEPGEIGIGIGVRVITPSSVETDEHNVIVLLRATEL